ncbi:hypothetical protein PGQ11_002541 [Apiospora arundinis]|uniref:Uncharacterized protein n=1 Tax=Apiospora arundinis TaxID=335852 RepID=A0ABR2JIF7_9PEZI
MAHNRSVRSELAVTDDQPYYAYQNAPFEVPVPVELDDDYRGNGILIGFKGIKLCRYINLWLIMISCSPPFEQWLTFHPLLYPLLLLNILLIFYQLLLRLTHTPRTRLTRSRPLPLRIVPHQLQHQLPTHHPLTPTPDTPPPDTLYTRTQSKCCKHVDTERVHSAHTSSRPAASAAPPCPPSGPRAHTDST